MTALYLPPPRSPDEALKRLVMRVPAQPAWEGFLTTEQPKGLDSHWDREQSIRCTGNEGTCVYCRTGHKPRWRGYSGFYNFTLKKHHVVELTEGAVEQMETEGMLAQPNGALWQWVRLWRIGLRKEGKLIVMWDRDKRPNFVRPASFEMDKVVARLYNLKD